MNWPQMHCMQVSLKVIHFLQMNAKLKDVEVSGPIFYNTIAVNDFLLGHSKIDLTHRKKFCMQRGEGGRL